MGRRKQADVQQALAATGQVEASPFAPGVFESWHGSKPGLRPRPFFVDDAAIAEAKGELDDFPPGWYWLDDGNTAHGPYEGQMRAAEAQAQVAAYQGEQSAEAKVSTQLTVTAQAPPQPPVAEAPPARLVQDWSAYPILAFMGFEALVRERIDLKANMSLESARIAEIDDQLKPALCAAEATSVYYGEKLVMFKETDGRRMLDKARLLLNGVTAEQIANSYKKSKGSSSITIQDRNAHNDPDAATE